MISIPCMVYTMLDMECYVPVNNTRHVIYVTNHGISRVSCHMAAVLHGTNVWYITWYI